MLLPHAEEVLTELRDRLRHELKVVDDAMKALAEARATQTNGHVEQRQTKQIPQRKSKSSKGKKPHQRIGLDLLRRAREFGLMHVDDDLVAKDFQEALKVSATSAFAVTAQLRDEGFLRHVADAGHNGLTRVYRVVANGS